jgi:hypothetical protein
MNRTELLNHLIEHYGYERYLEIGVNTPDQPGYNWSGINAKIKHGVDPNVDTTFRMTSNQFFEENEGEYDIVFVDGLHLAEQAFMDIVNARNCLAAGGCIVVHDCNPTTEITQRRDRASDAWHWDVWKALVKYRQLFNEYVMTVDTDEGCAVIMPDFYSKKLSVKSPAENLTFDDLDENRSYYLNLKDVEFFKGFFE